MSKDNLCRSGADRESQMVTCDRSPAADVLVSDRIGGPSNSTLTAPLGDVRAFCSVSDARERDAPWLFQHSPGEWG